MDKQFVSVLICTHNRAELLARTLDSLASVRLVDGINLEMIAICNGCTDNSVELIQEKKKHIPFDTHIVEETTPSLNLARNRGLSTSKGEIIAFLDDDVWVAEEWLEGLAALYRETPADMLAGRTTLWWENGAAPGWCSKTVESL